MIDSTSFGQALVAFYFGGMVGVAGMLFSNPSRKFKAWSYAAAAALWPLFLIAVLLIRDPQPEK